MKNKILNVLTFVYIVFCCHCKDTVNIDVILKWCGWRRTSLRQDFLEPADVWTPFKVSHECI